MTFSMKVGWTKVWVIPVSLLYRKIGYKDNLLDNNKIR